MKGEYGEPWRGTTYDSSIVNSLNAYVVCAPNDIIMARIVACVNACDGIDPEKLAAVLTAARQALYMVGQPEYRQLEAALRRERGRSRERGNADHRHHHSVSSNSLCGRWDEGRWPHGAATDSYRELSWH